MLNASFGAQKRRVPQRVLRNTREYQPENTEYQPEILGRVPGSIREYQRVLGESKSILGSTREYHQF
jgi:hypothetical protein